MTFLRVFPLDFLLGLYFFRMYTVLGVFLFVFRWCFCLQYSPVFAAPLSSPSNRCGSTLPKMWLMHCYIYLFYKPLPWHLIVAPNVCVIRLVNSTLWPDELKAFVLSLTASGSLLYVISFERFTVTFVLYHSEYFESLNVNSFLLNFTRQFFAFLI